MEGYWYTLNNRPIKRRLIIAATVVTPEDMDEMHKFEDGNFYDANRLAHSGGWIRPVAIRATQGHSFLGYHKHPLQVNIDHDQMNMKLTRDFSFRLGGGYHVTRVENLASLVMKGIIPGGGEGGRDHVFFGEYAPWDELNMSTLTYLGPDTKSLLVLYVPARRLLKYKSFVTYNGDIVVMETIPFHEVQDMWIAGISPEIGKPAVNPRKITSNKIANEVVCQCELASCSALQVIVQSVMEGMVKTAKQKGRHDLVDELHEHWEEHSKNPNDGVSAASMGAALVLVRYEVNPRVCSLNRLCPNCMFRLPKNMLSCPQCRGQFVSFGTFKQSEPIEIIYSKSEMDEKVKEQEKRLEGMDFPGDDVEIDTKEVQVVEKEEKKTFAPEQESKALCETHRTRLDEHGNPVEEEEDEDTVLAIMQERFKKDLENDAVNSALNYDPIAKIGRFFLFKIADFVINAYTPWKKFVFLQSDKKKLESMKAGYRHDVTGGDQPFIMTGPNNDEFALDRGLPVTLDSKTVTEHFQSRHEDGKSRSDGAEMARRYRFSVVITKLIEALYRRGHDLDGEFARLVKVVNKAADREEARLVGNADTMLATGRVEIAMEEAIRIAFGANSYSFVSTNRPQRHYAFDMEDFQSYVLSKSRGGNVRGEMLHVLHYYNLITVPGMIEKARDMAETHAENPVRLKFVAGTALADRPGVNNLMPIEMNVIEEANDEKMEGEQDEQMEEVVVEEVDRYADPNQPPPPLAPIVEDITAKEQEKEKRARSTGSKTMVEMTQAEYAEGVATGPPEARTPVILKPAKPEGSTYVPPTAKAVPKGSSGPASSKKEEKIPKETTEKTTTKEEAPSASDSKTKKTYQVKGVPKPTTDEVKPEPASASASAPTATDTSGAAPSAMAEPVDTTANADQGDGTSNLWGDFVGTGQSGSTRKP